MPVAAMTGRIAELLRPWLGSVMVDHTPLCHRMAMVLYRYGSERLPLADLREEAEDVLFNDLYDALGDRMTLRLDNGVETRIWLRQLPELADISMCALFELLPVHSGTYRMLLDHSLSTGSLSAMRVLYERYRAFQRAEETAELRRVLQERYPGDTDWLADQPSANPEIKEET